MSKWAVTISMIAIAVIAGCSNSRYSTRVSYVEPVTPVAYQEHDEKAAVLPPAHDRPPVPADDFVHELPPPSRPTLPSRQPVTRTVDMAETGRYEITFDDFRQHLRNNSAIIVDARLPKDFKKGHVSGAINIPAGSEDRYMDKLSKEVAPDELIIIYCGGPDCPAGDNVATYLRSHGYTNLRLYRPGWQYLSTTDLVD